MVKHHRVGTIKFGPQRLQLGVRCVVVTIACATELQTLLYLPAWRWCLFAAGIGPLWYATAGVMRGVVLLVESRWLDTYQAAYYLVSIRVGQSFFFRGVGRSCELCRLTVERAECRLPVPWCSCCQHAWRCVMSIWPPSTKLGGQAYQQRLSV